jgi:hypothetical protein
MSEESFSSGERIVATTFHPLAAKNFAVGFPMPDEVPVIKIVLFIDVFYREQGASAKLVIYRPPC